jgi:hypothetical protein
MNIDGQEGEDIFYKNQFLEFLSRLHGLESRATKMLSDRGARERAAL